MSNVRIGCSPFPEIRKSYHGWAQCVEISDTYHDALNRKQIENLKAPAQPGFEFFIAANRWLSLEPLDMKNNAPLDYPIADFGLFQDTAANREVWKYTRLQAKRLGAGVVFKSPTGFTPGDRNRANFEHFFRDIASDLDCVKVWEPRGLWTWDEASALANPLGLIVARDPFEEDMLPEPATGDAFYILTAPRGRTFFSQEDFHELAEFLAAHEGTVRAVFRGSDREANARRFAKFFAAFLQDTTLDPEDELADDEFTEEDFAEGSDEEYED